MVEALYGQQKQDWELTVTQKMNSLLQNSDYTTSSVLVYNIVRLLKQVYPQIEMAPHSSILAWRIPWTEEPGGL